MKLDNQQLDFESIVAHNQEKVRNICFRYVNNVDDADDIAQEVFIQVFESLSHFREEAQISTWVYRIAVNKSLDFIRSKNRKKRFAQLISLFKSGEDEATIEIPSFETPDKELDDKERKKILDLALDKLPENQKTAIVLSKYEGFGNSEIAKIMDLSLSAVDALIHRAKKNLQKDLHNYFEKNK
jgi:RNA polymerase sigma-70 factor (ECF subfamily)